MLFLFVRVAYTYIWLSVTFCLYDGGKHHAWAECLFLMVITVKVMLWKGVLHNCNCQDIIQIVTLNLSQLFFRTCTEQVLCSGHYVQTADQSKISANHELQTKPSLVSSTAKTSSVETQPHHSPTIVDGWLCVLQLDESKSHRASISPVHLTDCILQIKSLCITGSRIRCPWPWLS